MKKLVMVLVVMTGISFGAVFEDFEDGDITNNPTWIITNSTGGSAIVDDPIRSNNLVMSAYGSAHAQRVLETELDDTIPWAGFDLSVEFLSSSVYFHPFFKIYSPNYELGLEIYRNDSGSSTQDVLLRVSESGASTHDVFGDSYSPIDEWWRLNLWHDTNTGFVNAEIRLANDNTLLLEQSFLPLPIMATTSDISAVRIEVEQYDLQYIDNLALTPEPTTMVLLALGSILLRKRKQKI